MIQPEIGWTCPRLLQHLAPIVIITATTSLCILLLLFLFFPDRSQLAIIIAVAQQMASAGKGPQSGSIATRKKKRKRKIFSSTHTAPYLRLKCTIFYNIRGKSGPYYIPHSITHTHSLHLNIDRWAGPAP